MLKVHSVPDPFHSHRSSVLVFSRQEPGFPATVTFSQIVQIRRCKVPWLRVRTKKKRMDSIVHKCINPRMLIYKIQEPLKQLPHYLPLGVVSTSKCPKPQVVSSEGLSLSIILGISIGASKFAFRIQEASSME